MFWVGVHGLYVHYGVYGVYGYVWINVKWKSVRPHSVCGGEEQPRFRDGPPPPPLSSTRTAHLQARLYIKIVADTSPSDFFTGQTLFEQIVDPLFISVCFFGGGWEGGVGVDFYAPRNPTPCPGTPKHYTPGMLGSHPQNFHPGSLVSVASFSLRVAFRVSMMYN